ncbi:MAG TPA: redoxin domain-containing protein [Gemmatimonadales bacterium]|nr:redoxin domain-containing protein [Gemmatimonadales bacterium]
MAAPTHTEAYNTTVLRRIAATLLLTCFPAAMAAQEHPAHWTLTALPASVAPGGTITARLHARVEPFWHLYALTEPAGGPVAMRIAPLGNAAFTPGAFRAPPPDTVPDANFGIITQTYSDSVTLTASLRARAGAGAGRTPIAFAVTYQVCTTRYCLPARTDTVSTLATIAANAPRAAAAETPEDQAIRRVRAAYFAVDYAGGAALAADLATRFPHSRELVAWQVANLARSNAPQDAVAPAKALLAAGRVDPWGWFATAVALDYAGTAEDMPAVYDATLQALRRAPANLDVIWLRATILAGNSKSAESLVFLDSIARLRALSPNLMVVRAGDLYSTASTGGKTDTARRNAAFAEYAAARAADSTNVSAYYLAATRLFSVGRMAESYALLTRAVALSSAGIDVHSRFWQTLQTMKERSQASRDSEETADVESLVRQRPNDPVTLQQAASAFAALHLTSRQATVEERALTLFPNSLPAEWILVNRYRALSAKLEDSSAAPAVRATYIRELWDFVDRSSHVDPKLLGDAYRSLFYVTDSTTAADTLLRIVHGMEQYEGINPHITYGAGAIRLAQRGVDFAEAERLARAGIPEARKKIDEQRSSYETIGEYATAVDWLTAMMYDALGWVMFHEGKLDDAAVQLRHAIDLDPKSSSGFYHLGQLAERQGKPAEAETMYTRGSLIAGFGGNPNRDALKNLYLTQHGSLDGYSAYLANVANADRARRKDEITRTRATTPVPLPPFRLKTVDGRVMTLDSLKGKVAVINNWGMWCGPCVAEMPEFQKLAAQFAGDSTVRILTIDARDANVDDLRDWLRKKHYTFETLLDDGYLLANDIHDFPTTWVLDPAGRVVFTKAGWSEQLVEEFGWRIAMARTTIP